MYKQNLQSWVKHGDFLLWDLAAISISYWLAFAIRIIARKGTLYYPMMGRLWIVLLLIYFCVAMLSQSYKNILHRDRVQEVRSVILQILVSYAAFTIYFYLTREAFNFSRIAYMLSAVLALVLVYTVRIIWKRIIRLRLLENEKLSQLLVVSEEIYADEVMESIRQKRYNPFYVKGIVLLDRTREEEEVEGYPILCPADDLKEYILSEVVDEVMLNVTNLKKHQKLIQILLDAGITVHVGLPAASLKLPNKVFQKVGGQAVMTSSIVSAPGWKLAIKRIIDIVGGLVGTVITGILYLYLAPKIKKADPGPVFFAQERVGKNGRIFKLYKFRSMYLDAEQRKAELMAKNEMDGDLMFKMENDPRILPGIGKKIRESSMDEFPQFINCLLGSMSIVGTRPPTVDEFRHYEPHHKMRLSFKPGITGLWQTSGRSRITDFEEVVRMDNRYIRRWSLGFDLALILKTVRVVLKKEGAK